MADEIIVQYRFTDPDTGYSDAIVLPRAEFVAEFGSLTKLDTDKLDVAKAERVANWQAALVQPEPTVEEAKAQVVAEAESYVAQVEALAERRDDLLAKMAETDLDAVLVAQVAEAGVKSGDTEESVKGER